MSASDACDHRISQITRKIAEDTIQTLLDSNRFRKEGDCLISLTSIIGGSGYTQIQPQCATSGQRSRGRSGKKYRPFKGENHEIGRILTHQLAFFASTGNRPSRDEDVSHLCHNRRCFNAEHLVIESHAANMSRQRCLGTIEGDLPCVCCGSTHRQEVNVCKHTPKCIIKTTL